jgi:hypothetical protein
MVRPRRRILRNRSPPSPLPHPRFTPLTKTKQQQLHQSVTSAGNPITIDLKTRYKVKGIGSEHIIESVVKIHTNDNGERITGVEDRWNGNIPEGAFAKVGLAQILNPFWCLRSVGIVSFWIWSLVWWTKPWEVSGESSLLALLG